jgi:hypothetical protein
MGITNEGTIALRVNVGTMGISLDRWGFLGIKDAVEA